MMSRPTNDEYFLEIARVVATRSTCARRSVGCVLVDARYLILATGYNGVPRDLPHCTNSPCPGAGAESGRSLDLCGAIHAEQNAVAFCPDISRVTSCYLTASPCVSCVKLLLNTSCLRIVAEEEYPHEQARILWERYGRRWECPAPGPRLI